MRILLTNDDGIYAPGLRALRPELQKLGEVVVVAPAAEQSAVGHSVTLTTPLVVQEVLDEQRRPAGSLFNVNVPSLERGPVRGVRVVPQNVAPYVEAFDRRVDPRGRVYFWTTPNFGCPDPHPDTDVTALAEGYITVTPLQFDLTHAALLRQMSDWRWQM